MVCVQINHLVFASAPFRADVVVERPTDFSMMWSRSAISIEWELLVCITGRNLCGHQRTPRIAPDSFGQTCCQRVRTWPTRSRGTLRSITGFRMVGLEPSCSGWLAGTISMCENLPVGECTMYSATRSPVLLFSMRIARALTSISTASRLSRPLNTFSSTAQKNQSGSIKTICGSVFPECFPKFRTRASLTSPCSRAAHLLYGSAKKEPVSRGDRRWGTVFCGKPLYLRLPPGTAGTPASSPLSSPRDSAAPGFSGSRNEPEFERSRESAAAVPRAWSTQCRTGWKVSYLKRLMPEPGRFCTEAGRLH